MCVCVGIKFIPQTLSFPFPPLHLHTHSLFTHPHIFQIITNVSARYDHINQEELSKTYLAAILGPGIVLGVRWRGRKHARPDFPRRRRSEYIHPTPVRSMGSQSVEVGPPYLVNYLQLIRYRDCKVGMRFTRCVEFENLYPHVCPQVPCAGLLKIIGFLFEKWFNEFRE